MTRPKIGYPFYDRAIAPDIVSLKIFFEGLLFMVLSIMSKEYPGPVLLKNIPNSILECKHHTCLRPK